MKKAQCFSAVFGMILSVTVAAPPAAAVTLDFEDMPGSGLVVWMPPWTPYHDIVSMGPAFYAGKVGYRPYTRSMDNGVWSVNIHGGGNPTRAIVFDEEVNFDGVWLTRGQTWYGGHYVAAKWVQIVGKDEDGNTVGTTEKMYFVDVDADGNFLGYGDAGYYDTYRYLQADMNGVKTLHITSWNDEYNTSYYQMDNLEYSIIPEPMTLLAVLGGIVGLGGYVRRRRMV